MKKTLLIPFLILTFFLSTYFLANTRVREYRAKHAAEGIRANAPQLPPEVLKALVGEFRGIVADYLLIEAAAFIGADTEATHEDWDAVSLLFRQSMALDPHFKQTYYLVQTVLPWEAKKYDLTIELLEKSKKHRPWDWIPGFFIGFDYHFFLKDDLTASKYLMEASKVQDAPVLLATLGSRLAQKGGRTGNALVFLKVMYEKTDDEGTKKLLEERIKALEGVLLLEKGIEQFRASFGRPPDTLGDLVSKGILTELPKNPYEKPYTYENGQINF